MEDSTTSDQPVAKKVWHDPAVTVLDFDVTALTNAATPCDAGCCCCAYTVS